MYNMNCEDILFYGLIILILIKIMYKSKESFKEDNYKNNNCVYDNTLTKYSCGCGSQACSNITDYDACANRYDCTWNNGICQ